MYDEQPQLYIVRKQGEYAGNEEVGQGIPTIMKQQ